jgi:uncharacterized membrane protein
MTSSEGNETLGLGKNRIEALTDGIFATVMTILVLSLTIPVITQPSGSEPPTQQLIDELGQLSGLLPAVLTYIISFVILGVFWVGHHNLFHYVRRTDRVLLWINIAFLISVGLLPFTTAVLGRNLTDQAAVILYGVNLMLCGLLLRTIWWYATSGHRLVDHDLDQHIVTIAGRRIITGPIIFTAAISLSFISTWLSMVLYASAAIYFIIPSHLDVHFTRRNVRH